MRKHLGKKIRRAKDIVDELNQIIAELNKGSSYAYLINPNRFGTATTKIKFNIMYYS
jgi:hypothetical protein